MKEKSLHMENELQELREASERRLASDRVEVCVSEFGCSFFSGFLRAQMKCLCVGSTAGADTGRFGIRYR